MMKNLITGAGGMVGSHLVEILHGRGEDVLGTYYKPTVALNEIEKGIRLKECDVRYPQTIVGIIESYRPDRIYHLAAQSYPTVSWERPYETMDVNILGTIGVFEAVKRVRKDFDRTYDPIIVVACSSAEYGQTLNELERKEIFVTEDAPLLPLHPYGVSKVGQDLLAYQYFMNDGIRCIRTRIFNSTGTRKINDVTSDFTFRAVQSEKEGSYQIRVGNLDTRRAIMDQRDLINGLILLAEKGEVGGVYNISSEYIYGMRDIVRMIEIKIGHDLELIVDKELLRPTDEKVIAGDVTKLKERTGWKQEITMQRTIDDMIEYWRNKR